MPLKVSDGLGAWIKDFKKSDAPQFKDKDKKERRDMAIAAYYDAKESYDPNIHQEGTPAADKYARKITPNQTKESAEYKAGQLAAKQKKSYDSNPHTDSKKRLAWSKGHNSYRANKK